MTIEHHDPRAPMGDRGPQLFPCAPVQLRLWKEHDLARGGVALNASFRWRVIGAIEHSTLVKALQSLVARHEILRTALVEIDGEVMQSVAPSAEIELAEFDLVLLPSEAREMRAAEIAEAEAKRPFDLSKAPLMRASIVRCAKEDAILHLTFHSTIADGWSVGLLVRELSATCAKIGKGERPQLPDMDIQFADYALWQNSLLSGATLDAQRAFWKTQLRGRRRFEAPLDRPRPTAAGNQGEIRSRLLPDAFAKELDAFGRRNGVTRFTLACAALAMVMRRLTGTDDITLGTQVAGRNEPLAQAVVGPVMNTVPLVLQVGETASPLQLLREVGDVVAESIANAQLPFEHMPHVAEEIPRADRFPLYAINLVVQNAFIDQSQDEAIQADRLKFFSLPSVSAGALWDLSFFMVSREEGLRISCEANTALFDRDVVDGFLEAWQGALGDLLRTPGDDVHIPPMVATPVTQRERLLPVRRPADLSKRIIRLQPHGDQTPVIVLNNISVYHHVAAHVGKDRPFIDIQFYTPDGDRDPPRRAFEDYAADAVRMIRVAQPSGPYVLAGLCVYGALAFEAAKQLQREGESVQMVALFDTWAPGAREDMPYVDKILRSLQLRMSEYAARMQSYREGKLSFADTFFVNRALRKLALLPPAPMPAPVECAWFDELLRASCATYRPKPYDGEIVVFRSEEPLTGRLFPRAMGWPALSTRPVAVHDVPGRHLEMFRKEGAEVIGGVLQSVL